MSLDLSFAETSARHPYRDIRCLPEKQELVLRYPTPKNFKTLQPSFGESVILYVANHSIMFFFTILPTSPFSLRRCRSFRRSCKRTVTQVCALVVLLFIANPLSAQEPLTSGPRLGGGGENPLIQSFINQDRTWYQDASQAYHGNDLVGADGPLSILDWELIYTLFQWENETTVNPGVPYTPDDAVYPYQNGRHLIEIICENQQIWMQIEPALEALGATNISQEGYVMNAWLPIGATSELVNIAGIESVRPAYRQTRSGVTTSQGDIALAADLARALPAGLTGAGITVGTLSDSFATAIAPSTTADEDVANNDLPDGIQVLSELGDPGSDEGRAMMQIIHDLAPGVSQQFFTAFNGQVSFANGIRALDEAGCDIIVDDVFFFAEPMFQNGLIAQAVNDVSDNGKAYFSAAGNSGRQSYEAPFRLIQGSEGFSGGPLHDFDPGPGVDPFLELNIPVGSSVTVIFQWDEPFVSVSGPPGCQDDLDIFLTGSGDALSDGIQRSAARNVGGDALEIFAFTNDEGLDLDGIPGLDTTFNLVIEGIAGFTPERMKVIFLASDRSFRINEFDTQSGTLVGHANAEQAIAVAAAPFFGTPAFGVNPPQLEGFSSPGGNPLLFADDGSRLEAPLDTRQPRFTAADGANTTFFGQPLNFAGIDTDAFPNFFGTSAAAPHAAAVAALLLEKAGGPGSLSPNEVITVLSQTAIEMGPTGFDVESGAGLINAVAAVNIVESAFAPAEPSGSAIVFERLEFMEENEVLTSVEVAFNALEVGNSYLLRRSMGSGSLSNIVVAEAIVDSNTFTFTDENPSTQKAFYQLEEGQLP